MHADSTIYYAKQKVPCPPDFDQSAGVYYCPFGIHTLACYLPCRMPGTALANQGPWDTFLSEMRS